MRCFHCNREFITVATTRSTYHPCSMAEASKTKPPTNEPVVVRWWVIISNENMTRSVVPCCHYYATWYVLPGLGCSCMFRSLLTIVSWRHSLHVDANVPFLGSYCKRNQRPPWETSPSSSYRNLVTHMLDWAGVWVGTWDLTHACLLHKMLRWRLPVFVVCLQNFSVFDKVCLDDSGCVALRCCYSDSSFHLTSLLPGIVWRLLLWVLRLSNPD